MALSSRGGGPSLPLPQDLVANGARHGLPHCLVHRGIPRLGARHGSLREIARDKYLQWSASMTLRTSYSTAAASTALTQSQFAGECS
nr:uncharacterized protein LOC127298470 isoform X2 [Lolium perenne]